MDNENGTVSTKAPFFGLLAIPATIAIMLAMMVAATWNTVDYEASDWNKLLMMTTVLMAGGLLGKAPRIIFEPVGTRPSLVSLGFAVVIGAVGMIHYYDGAALLGLAFTMMAIGVHLYDRSRRHEEESLLDSFMQSKLPRQVMNSLVMQLWQAVATTISSMLIVQSLVTCSSHGGLFRF